MYKRYFCVTAGTERLSLDLTQAVKIWRGVRVFGIRDNKFKVKIVYFQEKISHMW